MSPFRRSVMLSVAFALAVVGCPFSAPDPAAAPDPSPPGEPALPRPQASPEEVRTAARASNQFGVELYGRLSEADGDRFISPLSVSAALGMTYAGASGATADEMRRVLRVDGPPERYHAGLGALLADLSALDGVELAVANRLFAQDGLDLLPPFLEVVGTRYAAHVGHVDWRSATEVARRAVNDWVALRTRDRIRDLLREGDVDDLTRLVLANAIWFKGAWAARFDEARTLPGRFTLASGEAVEAPFMQRLGEYAVSEAGGSTAVELPYRGDRLALAILLPERPDGLRALEEGLARGLLDGMLDSLGPPSQVDLSLPRFRIEDRAELSAALSDMGMPSAFRSDAADFSSMRRENDVYISRVIHQSFIELTEEGTEAAAATAVVARGRGVPPPPRVVRVDRPFLFVIRDRSSGAIVFMGRVVDPR